MTPENLGAMFQSFLETLVYIIKFCASFVKRFFKNPVQFRKETARQTHFCRNYALTAENKGCNGQKNSTAPADRGSKTPGRLQESLSAAECLRPLDHGQEQVFVPVLGQHKQVLVDHFLGGGIRAALCQLEHTT